MNADQTSIERIRSATFKSARRGYKKQDVDRFLASLADWLASGEGQEQSVVVKEALQDVGRRTSSILVTAEEAAQEIRDQAQKKREEADGYAKQTREQADQQARALKESTEAEAERLRSVAARDVEEMKSKAQGEVRTILDQGETRKAELRGEIEELGQRRESIVQHLDQLAVQLSGTADDHRPSGNTDETPAVKKQAPKGKDSDEDGASENGEAPTTVAKAGKAKAGRGAKAAKAKS
jgi:DivIVA domain-containing protein